MTDLLVMLDQFTGTSKNVRKTEADQIDDLVASIAAHGLPFRPRIGHRASSDRQPFVRFTSGWQGCNKRFG